MDIEDIIATARVELVPAHTLDLGDVFSMPESGWPPAVVVAITTFGGHR